MSKNKNIKNFQLKIVMFYSCKNHCILHRHVIVILFQISKCAVKDYNRGRDYLCDLASREGVQLFDDVTEAINCAISLLTGECMQQTSSSANLL